MSQAVLDTETIEWIAAAENLPDSDTTVLVSAPDETEPVWLGYYDGEAWYSASSSALCSGLMIHPARKRFLKQEI
jgi:hypothetical protein